MCFSSLKPAHLSLIPPGRSPCCFKSLPRRPLNGKESEGGAGQHPSLLSLSCLQTSTPSPPTNPLSLLDPSFFPSLYPSLRWPKNPLSLRSFRTELDLPCSPQARTLPSSSSSTSFPRRTHIPSLLPSLSPTLFRLVAGRRPPSPTSHSSTFYRNRSSLLYHQPSSTLDAPPFASLFASRPQSFSHSRKGSYPNNPNLTLGGGGGPMAMLGGIHKRSGSDLSVGGGMGTVGVGLVDGEAGYDNGMGGGGGGGGLWDGSEEIELFPSNQLGGGGGGTLNHSVPSSVPSHHNSSDQQQHNPSSAHLTRQDQLLYSSHSHSSSSSISPPSAHNSSTHSRGSSISSSASSHSHSHSLPPSRSGSISGLGSMMIEPNSSSSFQQPQGSGYREYAPSSLQMDVHSHVEGGGGTLPPSAMNFSHPHPHSHSHSHSTSSSAIVPSQRTSASPPRHALRARSSSNRTSQSQAQPRGATRGAGSSAAQLAIDDEEGLVVPKVLLEEGDNQRAMGKEADKDKAKMGFADFWLRASYSSSEKSTVSRQALFHSYNISCENLGLKAVNSASFGKAVRSTFLGIQTRRLGVRGNSKYHYCGIRPNSKYEQRNLALFGDGTGGTHWTELTNSSSASASGSEVEMSEGSEQEQEDSDAVGSDDEGDDEEGGGGMQTDEDQVSFDSLGADLKRSHSMAALRTPSQKAFDDLKTPTAASHASSSNADKPTFEPQPPTFLSNLQPKHPSPTLIQAPPSPPRTKPRSNSTSTNRARRHTTSSFPVPPSTSVVSLPGYPSLFDAGPLPSNTPPGRAARSVWIKFNAHLDALMEAVRNLRFDVFELNLRTFWQLPEDEKEVCHAPSMAGIMARAETVVFDAILEHLKAQTLSPIPPATIASLRSLSLNLEQILVASLEAYGPSFAEPKVELGARFGHLLLRFLDIYQISSALATLLSNETAIRDINKTFETIDFDSIRNHVALVCNCRPDQLVQILEVELRQLLKDIAYSSAAQNQNANRGGAATLEDSLASGVRSVQQLMRWADATADRLLASQAREAEAQGKTASPRGILIRWSFVTSEVMRDLTIRSDPSFGSFQILKIAFDEWIGFKVLRMVALSTTSVAASVDSVAQQTFFALSPLVEDSFSQHPSTTQNYHPSMARNNLILEPFPHHQDLQQRRAFASGSQAHRSGRSRASSAPSFAYDPTLGGFQQPPRPSQYDSRSNTFGQQLQPSYAQQAPAPALHVEMVGEGGRYDVGTPSMYFADSPATEQLSNLYTSSYSTPGSTTSYGNDPMGMGDLQKMVEGQHLGGGGGMEVESKGW